jgi:hypothetical protein
MTPAELKTLAACLNSKEPINGSNLRTAFLLLTRAHFSDSKNYGYLEEQLKCFKYAPGQPDGTLAVDLSQEYDANKFSKRPAIFVGLDQAFKFSNISNDQTQARSADNSVTTMGYIVHTILSIIHVTETVDQAVLLADSAASFFIGISEPIKNNLNLLTFIPATISPPALIEKGQERAFRVDVSFSLSFNYVVNANIESHRLKKFALELVGTQS